MIVLLLAVFAETATGIFQIWWRSETYTHGLLIVPIALWLIWRKRSELKGIAPHPAPLVLFLFLACLVGWSVSHLVGIQVAEQLMLVAMVVSLVWAMLGHAVFGVIKFPMLFLILAVPMGEGLIPPMMEFTASFTVWMLQLTGIPVYREGLFFVIPSGSWSVVEACSGVRYLIASVTLGLLYAYLTYQSLWRRIAFVALSVIVPIIANGLRAYLIVMIGHLSDMRLATGVDHLIYGWVFFGIVMLILFWVGSFWREDEVTAASTGNPGGAEEPTTRSRRAMGPVVVGLVAVSLSLGVQASVSKVENRSLEPVGDLLPPPATGSWVPVPRSDWKWKPALLATDHVISRTYRKGAFEVHLDVALYPNQQQHSEAINSQNVLVKQKDPDWRVVRVEKSPLDVPTMSSTVNSYVMTSVAGGVLGAEGRRLLAWQWYRLGSHATADPIAGKLLAAANLIYPGRRDGAFVVISTELAEDEHESGTLLKAFVEEMGEAVNRSIDVAVLGPAMY